MAIKIGGTEVINNSRELQNISGIDAGSITNLVSAGLGTPTPFVTETGTFTTNQFNFDTGNYFEKTLTENATFTFNESLTSGDSYEAKVKLAVSADALNSDTFFDLSQGVGIGAYKTGKNGGSDFTNSPTSPLRMRINRATNKEIWGVKSTRIVKWVLSTAKDITTKSEHPVHVFEDTDNITATVRGMDFANSGLKFYVVDTGDTVYEYTLSTAYDLSTATFVNSKDFTGIPSGMLDTQSIRVKPDGTKLYILVDTSLEIIYEYNMSTAYDITTATYSNNNLDVTSQDSAPSDFAFNDDGTKVFVVGITNDDVYEYSLSTAYDLSTASYTQAFTNLGFVNPYGIDFFSGGDTMFVSTTSQARDYTLSTPYDISTATINGDNTVYSFYQSNAYLSDFKIQNNGTKMYRLSSGTFDGVEEFDITNNDISNPTLVNRLSVATQDTSPLGLAFKPDGTKMYIAGASTDDIYEYPLSTAWDISSAGTPSSYAIPETSGLWSGLEFNDDGTVMYINDATFDYIRQYTLSTAWDITTASFDDLLAYTSQDSNVQHFTFNSDYTKLYLLGTQNHSIYTYTLSTAGDLATATLSHTLAISSLISGVTFLNYYAMEFIEDGSGLFVMVRDSSTTVDYLVKIALGDADPTITWPSSVTWYGGSAPSLTRGDTALLSLSTNDGGTSWYGNEETYRAAVATQAYSYISGATADNSATVEFTLPTGYDGFEFRFYNVTGDFDGAEIWVKVGTSNTIYTSYSRRTDNSEYFDNSTGSSNGAELATNVGTVSGDAGLSGIVYVDGNYADSATQTTGRYFTSHEDSTTADRFIRTNGMFATSSAASDTSIVFKSTSGSNLLETGTFTMYGIKSS